MNHRQVHSKLLEAFYLLVAGLVSTSNAFSTPIAVVAGNVLSTKAAPYNSHQVAQLRLPPAIAGSAPLPTCQEGPDLAGADLGIAGVIAIPASTEPLTIVRLVSADGALGLRIPAEIAANTELTVQIDSKSQGESSFSSVCKPLHIANYRGSVILAKYPQTSVWRIAIRIARPTYVRPLLPSIEVMGSTRKLEDIFAQENDAWPLASALLCLDRTETATFPKAPQRGYFGRVRLDVDMTQDEFPITEMQRAALAATILRSVSLWVAACSDCRPDHLAVVKIDGATYVRPEVSKWYDDELRATLHPPKLTELNRSLVDELERGRVLRSGSPTEWPRYKRLTAYQKSDHPQEQFSKVCALRLPANPKSSLSALRAAICAPVFLPTTASAKTLLRLRLGATACGDSQEIIGCRADSEVTEYNVRDFRFTFGADVQTTPIGNGPIELDLLTVVLHEMGHWIGLGHLDQGEGIMGSSLETARCIDSSTAKLLAESQRNQPESKQTEPSAFLLNRTVVPPLKVPRR